MNCAPRRVKKLFIRHYQVAIQQRAFVRMSEKGYDGAESLVNHGAMLQPLQSLHRKLDARRAHALLSIVRGSVFTDYDLMKCG